MKRKAIYYFISTAILSILFALSGSYIRIAIVLVFLTLTCLFALLVINRLLYYKLNKQLFGDAVKFWGRFPFNLQIVNLGSNSGKFAFDYSEQPSGYTGANWAIGPQSLYNDFNVLKNYHSYLAPGATVLISICPFSSLNSAYSERAMYKYYTFMHPALISDYKETTRRKVLFMKRYPLLHVNALRILLGKVYHKFVTPGLMNYSENANDWIKSWKSQFGINNLDTKVAGHHQKAQLERVETLSQMIDFCIERGYKPCIIIPPIHPALSSLLSHEMRANYIYNFLKPVRSKCEVLDCMDHSSFVSDDLFLNSYFLNEKGAKKFTRLVIDNIYSR